MSKPSDFQSPLCIEDARVDSCLDRALRELLSICFRKPGDEVFRQQRFFREPPRWHWIIRARDGRLAAHAAVHDKVLLGPNRRYRIGGIGDVCVHPDFRGRKLVPCLLDAMHAFLEPQGLDFTLMFGNPAVYRSSGYRPVENLVCDKPSTLSADPSLPPELPLARDMATPWPTEPLTLPGKTF